MPSATWPLQILLSAGVLATSAAVLVAIWPRRPTVDEWLGRRALRRDSALRIQRVGGLGWLFAGARGLAGSLYGHLPPASRAALSGLLEREGLGTEPETLFSATLLLTVVAAVVLLAMAGDGLVPLGIALVAVVAAPLAVVGRVVQRANCRRRAIMDQLPLLVDLMALEQGGGGVGARTAIELVVTRLNGEAAMLLRTCLTSSAMAGTPQLDRQLELAAQQLVHHGGNRLHIQGW